VASPPVAKKKSVPAPEGLQQTGHSVGATNVKFVSGQNVQQIMTESNGAVLEEDKILAITKIVLNLMEKNGHYNS
jgi:hypothetical protein